MGAKSSGIGFGNAANCVLDAPYGVVKFSHHLIPGKSLTLAEAYAEGWLNCCFVFEGILGVASHVPALLPAEAIDGQFNENVALPSEFENTGTAKRDGGVNLLKVVSRERCGPRCRDDELMLVGYVERMQPVQQVVPTRVRFEFFDYCDNIFSGDIYTSLLDGCTKAIRLIDKGELNCLGIGRSISDHAENQDIQSRTKVVNGIADDRRENGWDGLLGFNSQGALSSLYVLAPHELKRLFNEKGINLPAKVVDVVLGPLNLKSGSKSNIGGTVAQGTITA